MPPRRRFGHRSHRTTGQSRTRCREQSTRLTANEVRHLHPLVECDVWRNLIELVESGHVEVRVDRAGAVRVYPVGAYGSAPSHSLLEETP